MPRKSETTVAQVKEKSEGVIKAREKNIAQGWDVSNEITLAPRIRKVLLRCEGANPIKIHFDDDLDNNFWTLYPGDALPEAIDVVPGTVIKCAGQGGTSVLQCILWG